jgi:nanoRNase/pAp phosphatase (c-di-AMP/oligoRNAs hydrolase)
LVNDIASDIGGSGGGHDKASGAVIPKEKLEQFIQLLNKQIANDNENK